VINDVGGELSPLVFSPFFFDQMFMVDSTLKFVEFLSSGKYLLDFSKNGKNHPFRLE